MNELCALGFQEHWVLHALSVNNNNKDNALKWLQSDKIKALRQQLDHETNAFSIQIHNNDIADKMTWDESSNESVSISLNDELEGKEFEIIYEPNSTRLIGLTQIKNFKFQLPQSSDYSACKSKEHDIGNCNVMHRITHCLQYYEVKN